MNTIDTNPNFADPRGAERAAYRMYVSSLNDREKISYLQFLESNFKPLISNDYYTTFGELDVVILAVHPAEVVTRINYIYRDLNPVNQ